MLLLLAAGLAIAFKPVAIAPDKRPNLEVMIPTQFDDWKVDPGVIQVLPTPTQQKTLTEIYDQIVSRTYVNSKGERIMLTVTYGSKQTNQLKAHRQEICYTAQGFTISNLHNKLMSIAQRSVPVTRMFAVNGAREEPVTYWFTMGGRVVLSRFERLMVQVKFGLTGQIPDGVLVRISNLSGDQEHSYQAHMDFINALLRSMSQEGAIQLIGNREG